MYILYYNQLYFVCLFVPGESQKHISAEACREAAGNQNTSGFESSTRETAEIPSQRTVSTWDIKPSK